MLLSIASLMLAAGNCLPMEGQSKPAQIRRPCFGSTTPATVEIERDGDINLTPCSGRLVKVKGAGINNVFDVRSYGATLDDSTNDAEAVKSAIEAAAAAGGGVVYFPAGTVRIASKIQIGGNGSSVVFQGAAGGSRILFYRIGDDRGISLQGFTQLTFQDLAFVGEDNGSSSVNSSENNGHILALPMNYKVTFLRCLFLGIKSATGATIWAYESQLTIRDSLFGACTSPAGGVVELEQSKGAVFENTFWVDYHVYNGVYYDKLSAAGNTGSWIRSYNPISLNGGGERPQITIRDSGFDENNSNGLLNLTGSSDQTVTVEGVSFATGFGGAGVVANYFTGFREVIFRNTRAGLSLNTPDHSAGTFTNVGTVRLENFHNKYGAKWITLAGTTGRMISRNTSLVGNATYPTGLNNTAGALVDWNNGNITNVADASATANIDSDAIVYTSLTAGRTVNLPTAAGIKGKEIVVKDGAGSAAANNITIDGNGAETIDGAAVRVISTNYGSVRLRSNGANWLVF